jgi:uncharacterized membrane protein YkoI
MFRALLFTILATLPLTSAAAALARVCISEHDARQMIEQKSLLPLPEALLRFGNVQANQIVGVKLCRSDDRLVYEVEILEAGRKRLAQVPGAPT